MLQISNLCKNFGALPATDDVTLHQSRYYPCADRPQRCGQDHAHFANLGLLATHQWQH